MSEPALHQQIGVEAMMARLGEYIGRFSSVVVAYSGGVDSALVARVATDTLGAGGVLCVLANSETLTPREFEDALRLAREQGWRLAVLKYSELDIPDYAANPANRCYFCKSELYSQIERYIEREGLSIDAILDGTNADDVNDYRPGLKATGEHGVVSPLKECGLSKADVRALSAALGLPTADKPSAPCLSSRFPYGVQITPERLRMVAEAEECLRGLGFKQLRVRFHEQIARIEIPPTDFPLLLEPAVRETIVSRFREIGFLYVTLDLAGFRSGSLNEVFFHRGK
ncbi:MAG: ATP-dependent sacrificial sulfur transferase LarE [Candidatus Sumerlaeia bacterium]